MNPAQGERLMLHRLGHRLLVHCTRRCTKVFQWALNLKCICEQPFLLPLVCPQCYSAFLPLWCIGIAKHGYINQGAPS